MIGVCSDIEEPRARYSDLYDFAPIGYLTLDNRRMILEANLNGARQLGIERGRLVDTPLVLYIALQDRPKFVSFLKSLCTAKKQQNCEIKLEPKVGDAFFALLDGISVQGFDNQFCRISISDISERKEAEDALRISLAESRRREKEIAALLEGSPKEPWAVTCYLVVHLSSEWSFTAVQLSHCVSGIDFPWISTSLPTRR